MKLSVGDLNSVIPSGEGFIVSVFADNDFDGTPDPFPRTLMIPDSDEHTAPGVPASELPDEVALGQNSPNPFNTEYSHQLSVTCEQPGSPGSV